ncbi:MAG: hypothetical protein KDK62_05345, partial [Chlamydiia bacterium]|nr:hypothetical protein [Chlamydiia bacterium]
MTVEYVHERKNPDSSFDETSKVKVAKAVKHSWWKFWQKDSDIVAIEHERALRDDKACETEVALGRAYAMRDAVKGMEAKYKTSAERLGSRSQMASELLETEDLLRQMRAIYIAAEKERSADEDDIRSKVSIVGGGLDATARTIIGIQVKPIEEEKYSGKIEARRIRTVADKAMLNDLKGEIELLENHERLLKGVVYAGDYSPEKKRRILFFTIGGSDPVKPTIEQNKAIVKSYLALHETPFAVSENLRNKAMDDLRSDFNNLKQAYELKAKEDEEKIIQAEKNFRENPSEENLQKVLDLYGEAKRHYEEYAQEASKFIVESELMEPPSRVALDNEITRDIESKGFLFRSQVTSEKYIAARFSLDSNFIGERRKFESDIQEANQLLARSQIGLGELLKARDRIEIAKKELAVLEHLFKKQENISSEAQDRFSSNPTFESVKDQYQRVENLLNDKVNLFYERHVNRFIQRAENKDYFILLNKIEERDRVNIRRSQSVAQAQSSAKSDTSGLLNAAKKLFRLDSKAPKPEGTAVDFSRQADRLESEVLNLRKALGATETSGVTIIPNERFFQEWLGLKRFELAEQAFLRNEAFDLQIALQSSAFREKLRTEFLGDLKKLGLSQDMIEKMAQTINFDLELKIEPPEESIIRTNIRQIQSNLKPTNLSISDFIRLKASLLEAHFLLTRHSDKLSEEAKRNFSDELTLLEGQIKVRLEAIQEANRNPFVGPDGWLILEALKKERKTLNDEIGAVQGKVDQIIRKKSEIEGRLAEVENELEAFSSKKGATNEAFQDLKGEKMRLPTMLSQLLAEEFNFKRELADLKEKLAPNSQKIDEVSLFYDGLPLKWMARVIQSHVIDRILDSESEIEPLRIEELRDDFLKGLREMIPEETEKKDELIKRLMERFDQVVDERKIPETLEQINKKDADNELI